MCSALADLIERFPSEGAFSLWFGPVSGDPWLTRDAGLPHYAASMMKLPLLLAAFRAADRGALDLDEHVLVHDDFLSVADGSPMVMSRGYDNDPLPWVRIGERVPLRWLVRRMIVSSSNLAANLVLEQVGVDAANEALAASGALDSVFARGIEDKAAKEAGLTNLTSSRDLAAFLQALAAGSAASADACSEMLGMLADQEINDALPAGLPQGVQMAHKSGWVEGVSHDAGIVMDPSRDPFILAVCTSSQLTDEQARTLVAAGAAAAWADQELRR